MSAASSPTHLVGSLAVQDQSLANELQGVELAASYPSSPSMEVSELATPLFSTRASSAADTRHTSQDAGQAHHTPPASEGLSLARRLENTPADMTLPSILTQSVASDQPLNKNLPHFQHRDSIQSASGPQQGPRALFSAMSNPPQASLHHLRAHGQLSVADTNPGVDPGLRPAFALPQVLTQSTQVGLFGSTPALASRMTSLPGHPTSAAMRNPPATSISTTAAAAEDGSQKDQEDLEVCIYHVLSPAADGDCLNSYYDRVL